MTFPDTCNDVRGQYETKKEQRKKHSDLNIVGYAGIPLGIVAVFICVVSFFIIKDEGNGFVPGMFFSILLGLGFIGLIISGAVMLALHIKPFNALNNEVKDLIKSNLDCFSQGEKREDSIAG